MRTHGFRISRFVRNGLLFLVLCLIGFQSTHRVVRAAEETSPSCKVWPSEPPAGCPFPKSTDITGICFTGRHNGFGFGDTWYPSWAANGNLYSPWTDGSVNGVDSLSFSTAGLHLTLSKLPPGIKATTGYATIVGDDPMHLKFIDAGTHLDDPAPYQGRYPCGSLVYNGVWYYGTYAWGLSSGRSIRAYAQLAMAGAVRGISACRRITGRPGTRPAHAANPLFGETGKRGYPVKIGAPHFVDFGKNMEHSPDGKAYLVGHGARPADPESAVRQPELDHRRPDLSVRVKPSTGEHER